jgi:hypothetical protein
MKHQLSLEEVGAVQNVGRVQKVDSHSSRVLFNFVFCTIAGDGLREGMLVDSTETDCSR